MLYKNGELYKLTAKDIAEVKRKFKKFPVIVKYAKNRISPPATPHNYPKPDKPAGISVPFVSQLKTKSGIEEWRYAEHKTITAKGEVIWEPRNFAVEGTIAIDEKDIEKLWWLYNICPFIEGGKNRNKKPPKFEFEDKISDAERKAMMEERISEVKALIYSSKLGLGEEKLRIIAKAYFIPGVDEMTFAQVKLAVEHEVLRNKRDGYEKFLDMVNIDDVVKTKGLLQIAIDRKVIIYMVNKKVWAWVTQDGSRNEPFVSVPPVAEPHDVLYNHYKGNRKFAEQLQAAVKGMAVTAEEE